MKLNTEKKDKVIKNIISDVAKKDKAIMSMDNSIK